MSTPVLNAYAIRNRRLALCLSQRAVADQIAANTAMVSRIEAGERVRDIPLHQLMALADTLQMHPGDLFASHSQERVDRPLTADEVKVHAAITESTRRTSREELARTFGWTLKRTTQALRSLETQLQDTGQQLKYSPQGWSLRARPGVLDDHEQELLAREQISDRGLTQSDARVLQDIVIGRGDHNWERKLSNPQRVSVARLIKLGVVHKTEEGLELTDDAAFSLGA